MNANSSLSLNKGPDEGMGWKFDAVNEGKAIASGRAPGSQILFADINRLGLPRAL